MIMDWRQMAGRPTTGASLADTWKNLHSVWSGGHQVGDSRTVLWNGQIDSKRGWIIAACWIAASGAEYVAHPSLFFVKPNLHVPSIYFLYWLILLPFMFVSPQRIRYLFLFKAIVVPPAWIAILIWSFVKVPSSKGLFEQHSELSGSALSYAWLSALNSALGIYATLAVNIPDFTVSASRI